MHYKASLDSKVKIISTVICLLFIGIVALNVDLVFSNPSNSSLQISAFASIIFLFAILLICLVYAPQSYDLDDHNFTIRRMRINKVVPIVDIKEVRAVTEDEMKNLVRNFGVGGLFGYFGKFSNSNLGQMDFFATQSKNRILIVCRDDQKLIVTPDDMTMLSDIQAKLR